MLILGMLGARKATVTGGTLNSDSTWYYRVFTSSGTFAVTNNSINVEAIVIAGGGGGGVGAAGSGVGGGGGAGGLRFASMTLPAGSYPVTVGTGGGLNTNGTDSSFNSITSIGGGGGRSYWFNYESSNGNVGGSGGGGGIYTGVGGAGTTGQGFAGGNCNGGGGGGAGQIGSNGAGGDNLGGKGGDGISTYSSWSIPTGIGQNISGTYWLAGGGGGGEGGSGGKGGGSTAGQYNGGNFIFPIAAIANTGSGGAGATGSYSVQGTAGANGVVIIRYRRAAVGG